jgi:hypothetical protein
MDIHHIALQERTNTGTSWTKNESFDRDGYLVLKNLWSSKELYHPVPKERGQITYWGKTTDQFNHNPIEAQVEGSLARYWHPQYREIHSQIRIKLEKELGRPLYNTYYYDRFYFPGQELKMHADRDACEISVTVHISTNLSGGDEEWPIWIKTPDIYSDKKKENILVPGEDRKVILEPGDGMVYKGCERPHWREAMPGANRSKKLFGKGEELYYHQIFFHYVLQDGQRAHCAFDAAR